MMTPTVRWIFVLVGTALYLGLAILGWGGFAGFFAHSALVALTAVLFLVAVVAGFAGGSLSTGVKEDRGNRWVLPILIGIGLLQGYLPALTDRYDFWCVDGDVVRWIGVGVFAIGSALRLWPVFVLGNRFSGLVAIQRDHMLVTTGPYSVLRHPSYLGLLLIGLGWSLAFRSVVGIMLTVVQIPPLLGRIVAEERLLQEHFGTEYQAYRARTCRLIPGIY